MNLPDFNNSPYSGEMIAYERYKLYNWIIELKPKIVFEVGTGDGGGSTYYIAKSLKDLNLGGMIYTCDPIRTINNQILQDFDNIVFFQKQSNEMLDTLISSQIIPDFIMFDGPENQDIAFNDIKFLENHIGDNVFFSMHDWDEYRPFDGGRSVKSIKIRKYMESSDNWVLVEQLHSHTKNSDFDDTQYDSVGLCLYQYKK